MTATILRFQDSVIELSLVKYYVNSHSHQELAAFLSTESAYGYPMRSGDPIRFRALCKAAVKRTQSPEYARMVKGLYEQA